MKNIQDVYVFLVAVSERNERENVEGFCLDHEFESVEKSILELSSAFKSKSIVYRLSDFMLDFNKGSIDASMYWFGVLSNPVDVSSLSFAIKWGKSKTTDYLYNIYEIQSVFNDECFSGDAAISLKVPVEKIR